MGALSSFSIVSRRVEKRLSVRNEETDASYQCDNKYSINQNRYKGTNLIDNSNRAIMI